MGQRDVRHVGASGLVPFRPGESASTRHLRRLQTNLEAGRAEVEAWCEAHGVTLEIKNAGHHWIFKREARIVEWWPSSAKLVVGRRYRKGVHVHDWKQAIRELGRAL